MELEAALAAAAAELTPVAVVDEAQLERNLRAMARHAAEAGKKLRPHAKTHKSAFVARRQIAHGAVGLTVATIQEAEVFASAGIEDILIAHPPVGPEKLRRLGRLAGRVPRLAVAIDDVGTGTTLPAAVEVLWEVDSGLHRMGTPPGPGTVEPLLELAHLIGARRIRGLLTHGGHAYRAEDPAGRERAADEEGGALTLTDALLREAGFRCRVLSIGSSPTAPSAGRQQGINEIRPGTYVYNDANLVALGAARLEDCALAVVATVISSQDGRAVVDAGSKALSSDLRVPGLEGFGMVLGHPGLRLDRLSEEHGVLVGQGTRDLAIGQRLAIVPAHVCTTVNLHPDLLFFGAGKRRWEPVSARGWR